MLAKGLNTRLICPLPTNPHELIERFSCNLQEIDCVMDRCPTCCVAEIELQIQPSDSSDSADENESEQVIYFTWKKVDKRVTKAQQMVSFDDAVCTFKSQIKVLKEHIFVKRVQNDAYNKHKAELSDGDLLVHVDFAESYRNDQQNEIQRTYFGNQCFSPFASCCYFKGATSEIRNKSVVVVTENSDHNRITSMSCLKKVIDTMETEYGKSFVNVVL